MVTFNNPDELARYFRYVVNSEFDTERLEKAWHMYVTRYRGDGCFGCIHELLCAPSGSKKTTVANTGRFDCPIYYRTADGHRYPVMVESKTNGGRVRTIETEFSMAESMQGKFVVYRMDVCNSGTSYLRRRVDAVIIPRKLFIEKLREFNAIKPVNRHGELEGFGIQVTNKPLYLWLSEWPIVYERNAVYSDDDFEGLE